jgi:DNA mismatch repair protein MutS2
VSRLETVELAAPAPGAPPRATASWDVSEGAGVEVDVRGMESDDAVAALDHGLDRAVLGGFGELRVIHGVGRGVLRAAVERHLRDHPQVASHRPGVVGEGGRGVTIARLR